MKKNFYLDSIDCGVAHIVEEKTGKNYPIPLALLPKGAKEDEWYSIEICRINMQSTKNEIENLFDFLEHGKHF